jgi:uncharacterized membrane protein YphA (DoxX/SURF4 family)
MEKTLAIARILLGLVFVAAGTSGFLLISNPPPAPPGLAAEFQHVFFQSRWVLFVDGMELLCGILLLSNRYVPIALVTLAAILANILTFHATMQPAGLPIPLVLVVLWTLLAYNYRESFAPLFIAKRVA